MSSMKLIAAAAALTVFAGTALADAPAPARSVTLSDFDGRWYEIARTPNRNQPSCTRLQIDIAAGSNGAYGITSTCNRTSGTPQVSRSTATSLNGANNRLRFRATSGAAGFVGAAQEFWVLDRADDYSWAILGTPGGNYFWLWTRSANPANRAALMARVRALGYTTSNAVQTGG
ncbi:MAG TPA: lipocalin family protein [Brevundimonas sp.]|jgi:apolipoprotein D and lipocalin family protein|uniref:lipocalin family protein n=1 Tax=Brevundimonas sp. TaxID=1871086 RepID=UPI002CAE9F55|nr:lipocalin family protein [Brevundimonas sp.]HRH19658.1 lipocalin family protein [Brevundimonas sp.]